jgi:hypothetical protein
MPCPEGNVEIQPIELSHAPEFTWALTSVKVRTVPHQGVPGC